MQHLNNIAPLTAGEWLAKMAAADGVISANEIKLLKQFAEDYNIDYEYLIGIANGCALKNDQEVLLVTDNEIKGRKFEDFVVSLMRDKSKFTLLSWRGDKISDGIYAKENLMPDLYVRQKLARQTVEYFVECKYRTSWGSENCIDLSGQFLRYRRYAAKMSVELFIAIGVGGTPSNPEEFFIVPGRMMGFDKKVAKGRFIPCHCAKSSVAFSNYINHYYERRVFRLL